MISGKIDSNKVHESDANVGKAVGGPDGAKVGCVVGDCKILNAFRYEIIIPKFTLTFYSSTEVQRY